MHILLTVSTGYGKRLLPELVAAGHKITCCVRDANRFNPTEELGNSIDVLEVDLLDKDSLGRLPSDIDVGIIWSTLCQALRIMLKWNWNVLKIFVLHFHKQKHNN